jgi:ADP-heptose:LPS heptosyltransferase
VIVPPFPFIGRVQSLDGMQRILIIKLGALGDFIQALAAMQAIRQHHRSAFIALLTTAPFTHLARDSGLFDEIWIDGRAPVHHLGPWLRLAAWLRRGRFARVYDLQTSRRTDWYFFLMHGLYPLARPEWSGIAPFCSHPHANPARDSMHTVERHAEQLRMAGIAKVGAPDLSFLVSNVSRFDLPDRFALLVPGGAAHRPEKRWPIECYAALAQGLAARGVASVVVGAASELPLGEAVAAACPEARNLAGQTNLADIAELARRAVAAVGNDTGPMHIVAGVGCPSVVLFSAASDPSLCAPRGRWVRVFRRASLRELSVAEVAAAVPLEGVHAENPQP